MNQLSFEDALASPIAAKNDPATSHQAAREITESGEREKQLFMVLRLVQNYPLCTSFELARKGGIDRYLVARRLPELRTARYVTQRAARTCWISGRRAITWEAI